MKPLKGKLDPAPTPNFGAFGNHHSEVRPFTLASLQTVDMVSVTSILTWEGSLGSLSLSPSLAAREVTVTRVDLGPARGHSGPGPLGLAAAPRPHRLRAEQKAETLVGLHLLHLVTPPGCGCQLPPAQPSSGFSRLNCASPIPGTVPLSPRRPCRGCVCRVAGRGRALHHHSL